MGEDMDRPGAVSEESGKIDTASTPNEASSESDGAELERTPASELDGRVWLAMERLEQGFIFRKLGLCFDYVSLPGEFPRPTFARMKDARDGVPNQAGLGTGIAYCAFNGGLLFDGYLLRLELGLASRSEERILDRLIGGLIRTATIAPRNYLVRGLTPDGRGFYPASDLASHLLWAFSVWRGGRTAAIAVESQEKMVNITSKWIARLKSDNFVISLLDSKSKEGVSLTAMDGITGPVFLALLAVAAQLTGESQWQSAYQEMVTENGGARLALHMDANWTVQELLQLQIALFLLRNCDEDESRQDQLKNLMLTVARQASQYLGAYQAYTPVEDENLPDFDWRALLAKAPLEETGAAAVDVFAARIREEWPIVAHEEDTVQKTFLAALAILLCEDAGHAEPYADQILAALESVPFDRLSCGASLTAVISVYTRGVELGLWDEVLLADTPADPENWISVRPYMADDFDDLHPEAAGHVDVPPHKQKAPPSEKSADGDASGEQKKDGGRNRRRGRRRRRKK